MIRLIDVTITRGPNRVVDGLHLQVEPGSVLWVLGPNGAGKTSLLRVIAGLDAPRRGSVVGDGPRLLYFQSEMGLPPSSTVRSWERLVQRLAWSDHGSLRTAVWPDVAVHRRVAHLSTGQKKRLLLDAVLRQPGPLALDEPFEHLSPGAKTELAAMLEDRARRHEVVVATNQRSPVPRAGRILRLEDGVATEESGAATERHAWGVGP